MNIWGVTTAFLMLAFVSINSFAVTGAIEGKISNAKVAIAISSDAVRTLLPKDINLSHQSLTSSGSHPIVIVKSTMKDVRELGYNAVLGMNRQRTTLVVPFVELNEKVVNYAIDIQDPQNIDSFLKAHGATSLDEITVNEVSLDKQVMTSLQGFSCRISQIDEQAKFVESNESVDACL